MTGFLFLMVTFLSSPSSGESKNFSHWIFQQVSYQPLESPFQSAITCSNNQGRFKNKSTISPHKIKKKYFKNPPKQKLPEWKICFLFFHCFLAGLWSKEMVFQYFGFILLCSIFVVVQSPSHVWLFETPWTPGFPVPHHLPEFAPSSCPLNQWCHPIISSSVAPTEHIQLTEGGRGNQFPVALTCSHLQQIAPSKIWPLGFCFSTVNIPHWLLPKGSIIHAYLRSFIALPLRNLFLWHVSRKLIQLLN